MKTGILSKEAVVVGFLLSFVLNRAADGLNIVPPDDATLEWIAELVTAAVGLVLARHHVFSKATLRKADLNPEVVAMKAENSNIVV